MKNNFSQHNLSDYQNRMFDVTKNADTNNIAGKSNLILNQDS